MEKWTKYTINFGIEMLGEKHCLKCPIRDPWSNNCNLQKEKNHTSWDEQLEGCPLVEVKE